MNRSKIMVEMALKNIKGFPLKCSKQINFNKENIDRENLIDLQLETARDVNPNQSESSVCEIENDYLNNNNHQNTLEIEAVKNLSESDDTDPDPFSYSSEDYVPESESSSDEDSESLTSSIVQRTVTSGIPTPAHSPITPVRALVVQLDSIVTTTPRFARKRKRNPEKWQRNKLKLLRNSGNEYVMSSGKVMLAKQMRDGCNNCALKCRDVVTITERKLLFETFYKISDKSRHWAFIIENSKESDKKITKVLAGTSRRSCTRQYFLYRIVENKKEPIQVCQKTFIDTLSITSQWIETAYKKYRYGKFTLSPDKRGKFQRHLDPAMEQIKESVRNHINSTPAVEAHYLRERTTRKYIDGDLSVAKMHRLYLEWLKESNGTNVRAASLRQYRDTFNSDFNIGFHIPKKDQCEECHKYDNLAEAEKDVRKPLHYLHLHQKQAARDLKTLDKLNAIESNSIITACFDFQKVLPVPTADTSVFYYKRKLGVYIYDLASKQAKCYVWNETVGKKGANEVISCIYHFLKLGKQRGVTQFNLWSDNCFGQNKNRIVFGGYGWLSKSLDIDISHKFLEKGHTQNEGDYVHSVIEGEKKRKTIYIPEQWYSLIRNCRADKSCSYDVIEMTNENFYNFKSFSTKLNLAKNDENEKVNWTQIRQVEVLKNDPNIIRYKYSFEENFKNIITFKDQNTYVRGRKPKFMFPDQLPLCYNMPLPISREKLADLNYLCNHNYIPTAYHNFYRILTSENVLPESSDSD